MIALFAFGGWDFPYNLIEILLRELQTFSDLRVWPGLQLTVFVRAHSLEIIRFQTFHAQFLTKIFSLKTYWRQNLSQ